MSSALIIALLIGAAIIAGLAFYAGQLLYKLNSQKKLIVKKRVEQQQKLEQSRLTRNAKLADSIHLIARAMAQEQCEFSEGCLRIWVLMSQYSFAQERDLTQAYAGIFKMYEVVKEMPTHDARKKYSKKEIFKLDTARWRAEQNLSDEIKADCEKIISEFKAAPGSENVVFN
ncbi:DUF2489 domain-containing protein [Pseudoalteromonas sp. MMG010]|uniref:DUF2489 domain-containing protein n=1 Tax=Pseudoalteromonas sp. MMG010 TaxID=2822685 RepID=UPI001B3A0970|nr:DUF2489 domain-containing protein [Pseudoalteromonas sp. MMG010]MBQ4834186.1 DUF2489 domain-containing protein [Pseudoalteromonas sp. MMG010]